MKTVNELIEHLQKHNDAIMIIGPGILKEEDKPSYSIEEFNENYNRKVCVREPKKMWEFFTEKIYKELSKDSLDNLKELSKLEEYTQLSVSQLYNLSPIMEDRIDLHGNQYVFTCPKCKTIYSKEYVFMDEDNVETECEVCGSNIRPSVLLAGERYNHEKFENIKEAFANTHTVILVGMDYTEESLLTLLADYESKRQLKVLEKEANKDVDDYVVVAIQDKQEQFDPNELLFCNFLVRDDIKEALKRLNENF